MKQYAMVLGLVLALCVLALPCMAQGPIRTDDDAQLQGVVRDRTLAPCALPDAVGASPGQAQLTIDVMAAPEGALITDLSLNARVEHIMLSDLVVKFTNDQGVELLLWDRQGAQNDAGLDDDIADDADIEILARACGATFAGCLANQRWHLEAWDHVPTNQGTLEILDLELSYASGVGAQSWIGLFGPEAGGWSDQDTFPRMLADVDGDGMDDMVAFGNRAVYVSLSEGAKFAHPTPWLSAYGPASGGWTSQNLYPWCCGDANGDGLDDIVAFGNRAVYVSLSDGTRFEAPVSWLSGYGVSAGGWTDQDTFPRMVGDVNGDGRADIVGCGDAGAYVSLSTGNAFAPAHLWVSTFGRIAGGWESQDRYPRMLADVDADGLDDLVGFGNKAAYVAYSTGARFQSPVASVACFGPSAGGWQSQNVHPRMLADMDGDGDADIIGFGDAGAYASLCLGESHGAPWTWLGQLGRVAGGWSSQDVFPRMVGDVDGDGRADIVGCGNKATYVALTR